MSNTKHSKNSSQPTLPSETVRLDKWLWAARFYKTRGIAQEAIAGGKVHLDGQRVKAGKAVRVGNTITLRQGFDEKEVLVLKISDKRRGAPEAQTLYEETAASIEARAKAAEMRRLHADAAGAQARPDKKQRRQLMRLKQEQDEH